MAASLVEPPLGALVVVFSLLEPPPGALLAPMPLTFPGKRRDMLRRSSTGRTPDLNYHYVNPLSSTYGVTSQT